MYLKLLKQLFFVTWLALFKTKNVFVSPYFRNETMGDKPTDLSG